MIPYIGRTFVLYMEKKLCVSSLVIDVLLGERKKEKKRKEVDVCTLTSLCSIFPHYIIDVDFLDKNEVKCIIVINI
jgi:hypothetical protein